MFKRPTSRRRTKGAEIQLNLVPILDAMVTLIAFMLFSMSFLQIVAIETPFPTASANPEEEIQHKPLQLSLTIGLNASEIWSPFENSVTRKIPHLSPGQPNLRLIHDSLVEIKRNYPRENRLVLAPNHQVKYETLIYVMDAVRFMEPTDPTISIRDEKSGNEFMIKDLFPNVIFGNLLGEA